MKEYLGIICPQCGMYPVVPTVNKAKYFICCNCHTKLILNKK